MAGQPPLGYPSSHSGLILDHPPCFPMLLEAAPHFYPDRAFGHPKGEPEIDHFGSKKVAPNPHSGRQFGLKYVTRTDMNFGCGSGFGSQGSIDTPICRDMFAEMGLLFPHLPEVGHHGLPLEEELFCRLQSGDGPLFLPHGSATRTTISDYDLGAEGDLFRAPEPIMEESVMELDYFSAAMSMMCNGGGVICAAEAFGGAADPASQDQQLFADDLTWTKPPTAEEAVYSDLLDVKLPSLQIWAESMLLQQNDGFVVDDESAQKSLSSGCCCMLEQMSGGGGFVRPAEMFDFQGLDLGGVFGMRHAYSDGDIQAVSNGHMNHFSGSTAHLPFERLLTIGEERRQKLSRYRKKRTKRNFGRKIKYACRKALADSQPRVRGRFAKTEELDTSKPSK